MPTADDDDRRPADDRPATEWTKGELLDAAGISAKTFDLIRKAARLRGPSHGGLDWTFSADDVIALIHRAESGRFSDRGPPAAEAWRALLEENGITVKGSEAKKRRR